jgi:hypothetical protein
VTVISTIKGYGDYFWVDVVEKIDEMGETVNQYQAQVGTAAVEELTSTAAPVSLAGSY